MPLIALVIVSALAGGIVAVVATRLPRAGRTEALVVMAVGGLVVAVLAFFVRGGRHGLGLDLRAEAWGASHATALSTDVLDVFTDLGRPGTVVVLAIVLALVETARTRSRWIIPFLLLVVAGNGIVTTTIKHVIDRARPTLNPIAETLGPSFPSGHSSWSAAFFAAAALLLARGRAPGVRIVLTGLAAALAVGIAASRVLLGVHWLSDVVAGLSLGWAWFAACALAFGARLRTGATVSRAARPRERAPRARAGGPRRPPGYRA